MGMRCFACSLTPILAVAGLLGLGAAGYRVAQGGCPLCHHGDAATTTKLVSTSSGPAATSCPMANMTQAQLGHTMQVGTDQKPACCAGMTEAECQAKMAQCPAASGSCPAHPGCCGSDQKSAAAPEKVATTSK